MGSVTSPQNLDERFRESVAALSAPEHRRAADEPVRDGAALTGDRAAALFDAQLTARHLDLAARWLRSFGEGWHTVGSAGHEGDAAVAAALRPTDPALLHTRSAGFWCARAAQARPAADPDGDIPDPLTEAARDVLRGVVASAAEPGAGGRRKVFGSAELNVVPTAATDGAHLPRAVGLGWAIGRSGPGDTRWPDDALVVCEFGDAALDRAAAATALATAGRYAHTGEPLPLLLVCADNGWGGAVRTPGGWTEATLRGRPGLRYSWADGCDLVAAYEGAREAADWVREHRRPAVLHLSTVRLLGHDGGDAEAYRPAADIGDDAGRDPLVATARLLVAAGRAEPGDLISRYDEIGWRVRKVAEEVLDEPKIASGADIVAPLAPRRPLRAAKAVTDAAHRALGPGAAARQAAFGGALPEDGGPLDLAQTLHATLADWLVTQPRGLVLGPGVAGRGGEHGVTRGLAGAFPGRVVDTAADASAVAGLALGAGLAGWLPVAEIADLHDTGAQLRGEAAALSWLSTGAWRNPLVVRVPGLAPDQAGTGIDGNAVAVLRDVPGLVVAVPARPADAAPLLRACLTSAAVDGSVCVVVEPAALYRERDLLEPGDGGWLAPYAPPGGWAGAHVPVGRARTYTVGGADDLTIVTFGAGVRLSLRVAARLAAEGYGSRVVDLRWLAPLPVADIVRESAATGRVLVVDETRRSGGAGEGVLAALVDGGYVGAARRIAAADSLVPAGPAARHVLIGEDAITQGARTLLAR
ncbi:MFS transporter [Spirilliplanes yamanashiensis]|uniref:MFS transporter n=1 Tax=Spirilliplanes yamanashiensis TaxID=42233 RepID=A0A8J4DMH8_9ACTN|nr:MFS transporter [Spirilliplanes yamanashiensis]